MRHLFNSIANSYPPLVRSVVFYFLTVIASLTLLVVFLVPACTVLDQGSELPMIDRGLLVKSMIYVQRNLLELEQQRDLVEMPGKEDITAAETATAAERLQTMSALSVVNCDLIGRGIVEPRFETGCRTSVSQSDQEKSDKVVDTDIVRLKSMKKQCVAGFYYCLERCSSMKRVCQRCESDLFRCLVASAPQLVKSYEM